MLSRLFFPYLRVRVRVGSAHADSTVSIRASAATKINSRIFGKKKKRWPCEQNVLSQNRT